MSKRGYEDTGGMQTQNTMYVYDTHIQHIQTHRQDRQTHTDTHIDTHTDKQTHIQTGQTHNNNEFDTQTHIQTGQMYACIQTYRHTCVVYKAMGTMYACISSAILIKQICVVLIEVPSRCIQVF